MALTCKGKINLRENKVYDKCSNTCDFTTFVEKKTTRVINKALMFLILELIGLLNLQKKIVLSMKFTF